MIDCIYLFKSKFTDLFLNNIKKLVNKVEHAFIVWCINDKNKY